MIGNFADVWIVDFEFTTQPGERPQPICLVAREWRTGREVQLWQDELRGLSAPPYNIGPRSLLVAYYSSAELGCHLSLGWALAQHVLDLYVEFRHLTNGRQTPCGRGLLGALAWFGLDSIEGAEKESMRQLALRGGPWSSDEKRALLAYCRSDVLATERLLGRMLPDLDLPRALLRGRFMRAAACMENTGIPIDMASLKLLAANWVEIQHEIIRRIDVNYGVYKGSSFKVERFEKFLREKDIPWPRLDSGRLALDDDTFRDVARSYPRLQPLKELRASLSQLRLGDLAVGRDGRNRCLLSAFSARTGRNQPSNTHFIFGPAVWLRSLIQPPPGYALAYVDWEQQEFGIAAALSGDPAMIGAYESGDPYLAFAKQAGAAPASATKATHAAVRDQFKACALAVQYGMSAESLALRIGQPKCCARELLNLHRETYRKFWRWSDGAVDYAMLRGHLYTVFGWQIYAGQDANPRSLRNFPMQANGAEMLRLACSLLTESGMSVCAPVHDAILIEAPADELPAAVEQTKFLMARASELVLDGFRLRSEVKAIYHPNRYNDDRGTRMWDTVWQILGPK